MDPFVGTGGLLYVCAFHGAMVLGADINRVLLLGWGKTPRSGGVCVCVCVCVCVYVCVCESVSE